MSLNNNISPLEEQIRQTMENAEVQAPDGVWENISPQIEQPVGGGGKSFFRSNIFKGVASAIIVGGTVAAIWMNQNSVKEDATTIDQSTEQVQVQDKTQDQNVSVNDVQSQDNTIENVEQPAQKETNNALSVTTDEFETDPDDKAVNAAEGEGVANVVSAGSDEVNSDGPNNRGNVIVNDGVDLQRETYMSLLEIYLSDSVVCKGNTVSISVQNRNNLQFFESFHWEVNGKNMGSVLGLVYKCNAPGRNLITLSAEKDGKEYSVSRYVKVDELKGEIEAFRLVDRRSIQGLVKNQDLKTVTWYFGDNQGWETTNSATLNHTYQSLGVYPLIAVITDERGCSDTAKMMMKVLQDLKLSNNILTPSLPDGKNDVFEVEGMDVTSFRMTIRDAYGNIVFESNDINTDWECRNMKNGETVPTGTYVYSIRYTQGNSKPMEVKGTLVVN